MFKKNRTIIIPYYINIHQNVEHIETHDNYFPVFAPQLSHRGHELPTNVMISFYVLPFLTGKSFLR